MRNTIILGILFMLTVACSGEAEPKDPVTNDIPVEAGTQAFKIIQVVGHNEDGKIYNIEIDVELESGSESIDLTAYEIDFNGETAGYTSIRPKCRYDEVDSGTFCSRVKEGNDDHILEDGEMIKMKYKAIAAINPGDAWSLKISKGGTETNSKSGTAPGSYDSKKITLG